MASPPWSCEHQVGHRLLGGGFAVLTTGQDGSVVLRDGVTGELLGSVLLPDKVTSTAAFGADQNTVVIASHYDGLDKLGDPHNTGVEFRLPPRRP